jgi:hypothetical protein
MIPADNTTPHCRTQTVQERDIAFVLYYGQLRKDLIAEFDVRMFTNAYVKTPFAINESGYPIGRKFLGMCRITNVWSLRGHFYLHDFPADCPHVRCIFTAPAKKPSE